MGPLECQSLVPGNRRAACAAISPMPSVPMYPNSASTTPGEVTWSPVTFSHSWGGGSRAGHQMQWRRGAQASLVVLTQPA